MDKLDRVLASVEKGLQSEIAGRVAEAGCRMREETPGLKYLSIGEAAARLGVCEMTIRRYLKKGSLSFGQPGGKGGRIFVLEQSVENLVLK